MCTLLDTPTSHLHYGSTRFSKENFPKILELVDAVAAIGKKHNATAGQIAIAWLLAQGDDIIPIPGTKKLKVRFLLYPVLYSESTLTNCVSDP